MAKTGDLLENPVTGQSIRIIKSAAETGGLGWEYEWIIQPMRGRDFPAVHLHPVPRERFEILAGQARYEVGGVQKDARPGDLIEMPVGVPHRHPWSASNEVMRMRHLVDLEQADSAHTIATEQFFERIFHLARLGKTDRTGMPNLLHFAIIAYPTLPLTLLPGLPAAVQVPVVGAVATVGRWFGYR